jgi:hypothetical protein
MTLLAAVMVAHLEGRRAASVIVVTIALAAPFTNWHRTADLSSFSGEKPHLSSPGEVFPDPRAAWEAGSGGWYWRHHSLAEIWLVPRTMSRALLQELAGKPVSTFEPVRRKPAGLPDGSSLPMAVLHWGQVRRDLAVEMPATGTLLWRLIPFPGHHLSVDGRDSVPLTDMVTGLVSQRVEAGPHLVSWTWEPFPALRRARAVSTGAVVVIAMLLLGDFGVRRRRHRTEDAVIEGTDSVG